MAPWIKTMWHRGLAEQTKSLVAPASSGKALCSAQPSVRGGQGDGMGREDV